MIPCITPLIFKKSFKMECYCARKAEEQSCSCFDYFSNVYWQCEYIEFMWIFCPTCTLSFPPAARHRESDATLEEVTGCHCLCLLIFTSPYILSIKFKLLPQVANTLRVTNGLQMHLTLWGHGWGNEKWSVDMDTIKVLWPW